MPVFVSWDETDPNIATITYKNHWSWQDHHDAIALLNRQGLTRELPYAIILDISQTSLLPPGALDQLGQTLQSPPHKWCGLAVFVPTDGIAQKVMAALLHIYNQFSNQQTYLFARSRPQAKNIIHNWQQEAAYSASAASGGSK